jgi:peptidoglycan-associated lipoprotein
MRSLIRFATLLGLALTLSPLRPALVAAQEVPLAEMGADYNYVHTNAPPGGCGCFSMNGGDGWFAYNLTDTVAAVAQLSSQHASNVGAPGSDLTLTSYLFGPRYSWRKAGRFVPFSQVLLGGAYASGTFAPGTAGYPGSSNAFAMTVGAGLDIALNRRVAVRAFQADYYLTHFANSVNDHQNNLRISAGLVFRFGKR